MPHGAFASNRGELRQSPAHPWNLPYAPGHTFPGHTGTATLYPVLVDRGRRFVLGLIGIAGFVLIAGLVGLIVPPSVLPSIWTVLARAAGLVGNGRFLADVGATLEAWALGMLLTAVIAVPVGLILGTLPGVRFATRAIVEFLRPIPSVALILLVGLVVGSGLHMMLILIVYGCSWPVLYNTITGLHDTDPVARETLRAFGFGRLSVVRLVSLPSAAPFIFTGLRIASTVALILDIAVGYVTGRIDGSGIGAFIADANSGSGNIPLVLAATLWTGFLGLVLNALLVWAERRILPWHRASLGLAELTEVRGGLALVERAGI
jgi:NitT/TauT family transport system permease protein